MTVFYVYALVVGIGFGLLNLGLLFYNMAKGAGYWILASFVGFLGAIIVVSSSLVNLWGVS